MINRKLIKDTEYVKSKVIYEAKMMNGRSIIINKQLADDSKIKFLQQRFENIENRTYSLTRTLVLDETDCDFAIGYQFLISLTRKSVHVRKQSHN